MYEQNVPIIRRSSGCPLRQGKCAKQSILSIVPVPFVVPYVSKCTDRVYQVTSQVSKLGRLFVKEQTQYSP